MASSKNTRAVPATDKALSQYDGDPIAALCACSLQDEAAATITINAGHGDNKDRKRLIFEGLAYHEFETLQSFFRLMKNDYGCTSPFEEFVVSLVNSYEWGHTSLPRVIERFEEYKETAASTEHESVRYIGQNPHLLDRVHEEIERNRAKGIPDYSKDK